MVVGSFAKLLNRNLLTAKRHSFAPESPGSGCTRWLRGEEQISAALEVTWGEVQADQEKPRGSDRGIRGTRCCCGCKLASTVAQSCT